MLTRMMQLLSAIAGTGNPPAWPNWPLTSDEVYLYAIMSGETDVPRPLTRRQQYLYRRATGSGELPEYPVTTEEIYWSVFAGEERELPRPLTELMPYIAAASAPPEPSDSSLVGTGTVGSMIVGTDAAA